MHAKNDDRSICFSIRNPFNNKAQFFFSIYVYVYNAHGMDFIISRAMYMYNLIYTND